MSDAGDGEGLAIPDGLRWRLASFATVIELAAPAKRVAVFVLVVPTVVELARRFALARADALWLVRELAAETGVAGELRVRRAITRAVREVYDGA
jgi:hypothetical protein